MKPDLDTKFKILHAVDNAEVSSQRELAKVTKFSLGKTNYVLNHLFEKGLIKLKNFSNSSAKHQYLYFLTPKGVKEKGSLMQEFIAIKQTEFEELKKELEDLNSIKDGESKQDLID